MREALVNGLRIAYQQVGSGPPLVLLHGGANLDSRMWRWQLDGLRDEFTVIAWDMPGVGQSSDPPETYTMADYADCLAGLLGALGLARAHILGLSLGSLVALEFYRLHPEMTQSLILAVAYAGWAGSLPPEMVEQRIQRAIEEAAQPPEQWIPRWLPELLTGSAPPGTAEEVAALMAAPGHPSGSRTLLRAFGRADFRETLPTIHVPTLLIWGDADVRSPLTIAEQFRAAIPAATFVLLPGVGHMSNANAPDQFNAAVRDFLIAQEA